MPPLLPRVIQQRWIHGASGRDACQRRPEIPATGLAEVVAGAFVPDSIARWLPGLRHRAIPTDARRRAQHNTVRDPAR